MIKKRMDLLSFVFISNLLCVKYIERREEIRSQKEVICSAYIESECHKKKKHGKIACEMFDVSQYMVEWYDAMIKNGVFIENNNNNNKYSKNWIDMQIRMAVNKNPHI